MAPRPDAVLDGRVAVVGMFARVPGARGVEEYWRLLRNGEQPAVELSDEELSAAGVGEDLLRDPRYVKRGTVLEGVDEFDASFFGYTPREAREMDPQQRLFLEGAWHALEHAGYDSTRYPGSIGVYAGSSLNTYLLNCSFAGRDFAAAMDDVQTLMGSDKDFLATRVSYHLDLDGPSLVVQSTCSTSLVAVCQAYQALLTHQCDMALAGGVCIRIPQGRGHLHTEEGILSHDGHCRPFDAEASGTFFSNGLGIVVLKRLEDALQDGDRVYAVLLGAAVNNDGAHKVGYTAPSVKGQAEVIAMAQGVGDVDPATVGLIEAHGTGTRLGDPIEFAALCRVFRTRARGSCALGSVKANLGHLDTASGVAGLIKAVLALHHREIPPAVDFERPNPDIDLAASPFFVPTEVTGWTDAPRRAGVSSFGIGGTNAHVVLEEAPELAPASDSETWQLLPLSAKTPAALVAMTDGLAQHLRAHPEVSLADVAYTLQVGRREFAERRAVAAHDVASAIAALESAASSREAPEAVSELRRSWLAGEPVDWDSFHAGARRRRVALPGYPFELERFWAEPAAPERDPVAALRVPSWKRSIAYRAEPATARRVLLFSDGEIGDRLVALLRARGDTVLVVRVGTFGRTGDGDFTLDPSVPEDHARLWKALRAEGLPERIVHLWLLGDGARSDALDRGFRTLVRMGQDLVGEPCARPREATVVTAGLFDVTGREELCPDAATVVGPCRVIPLHDPRFECALVDVDPRELDPHELAAFLFEEVSAGPLEPVVALRGRHRWIPVFEPVPPHGRRSPLRERGVYLVTGGLGGIGLELAAFLARTRRARLVLVGRTEPGPGDPRRARIEELRALGADVVIEVADVADETRMAEVFRAARERFGALHGILHAAGVHDGGTPDRLTTRADDVLAPKVRGTRILHDLCDEETDFLVLFSSVSSITGDVGQAAYVSASAFLDAFALSRVEGERPFVQSIDWDVWRGVGMAAGHQVPEHLDVLDARQGIELFQAALASGRRRVVASRRDLEPAPAVGTEPAAAPSDRVAPRTPLERSVAGIWSELLGLGEIGVHDDFLDLGGHSLLATQLLNRLRRQFEGADLSLVQFFDNSTVAELALLLEPSRPGGNAEPLRSAVGLDVPPRRFGAPAKRVGGVAFVLAAPRSGSTLLRLMLSAHPEIFCPPELWLLPFEDLDEWSRDPLAPVYRDGLVHALAERLGLEADGARAEIERLTQRGAGLAEVYDLLRGDARLLVDKTPGYTLSMDVLRRAEDMFDEPRYVHLVRHPAAVVESFVRKRFDRLMGETGDPLENAERFTATSVRNVLSFQAELDASRFHSIRFEDLVRAPAKAMEAVCRFLGVPFDASVLDPYAKSRMREGPGDPDVFLHDAIDPTRAGIPNGASTRPEMALLAQLLGYETLP